MTVNTVGGEQRSRLHSSGAPYILRNKECLPMFQLVFLNVEVSGVPLINSFYLCSVIVDTFTIMSCNAIVNCVTVLNRHC